MMRAMAAETQLLLAALADAPDGLTRPELLARLREQVPYLRPADVERAILAAEDAVYVDGERVRARPLEPASEGEQAAAPALGRFIVFDVESIVRPTVKEPYREQHVFQIGAVRFGPDADWVAAQPEFVSFTALKSDDDEQLIYTAELRERYQAGKRPLAEVLAEFRDFCAGADSIVAYNGVAHDFRLLEEELARCELPPLLTGPAAPRLVDALYLAQALWPIPPRQHRLLQLLQRLEIDVDEMVWHDARDDSRMVVELLTHGAREFLPSLGEELLALLDAAAGGSDAWELLLALAGRSPQDDPHDHARTARVLQDALEANAAKEPLRPEPRDEEDEQAEGEEDEEQQTAAPLEIPGSLRGEDGRVSLDKLVAAVKGEGAEARDSQRLMVARLRDWLEEGAPALCEAPTGTGKSYAILAAGLDWLDADPAHKVVISTYTKQLQSQLAADIEALTEAAMPELSRAADMVKGSANRLSLRALVYALAELTEPDRGAHRRGRQDFSDDHRYRDLVLYLALRFLAEGSPTEEWESRSVDRVDVPAFFDEYCPRRLALYLASLSQAENADYRAERGGIGRYTRSVREALEAGRMVIANHALLLAHLDDFEELGEKTLLFVDEAHELENAATNALSPELDSGALAELAVQVAEWAEDQAGLPAAGQLADAVTNLDRYLEDERLARAAMRAFDTAERDPLGRALLRTVTVASPLQGDAFVQPMEHLAAELRTCRRIVGLISEAFRRVAESPPADPFELDRMETLWTRTADVDRALVAIVRDVDAVLAPAQGPAPADAAEDAEAQAAAAQADEAAAEADEAEQETIEGAEGETEQLVALDEAEEAEAEGLDTDQVGGEEAAEDEEQDGVPALARSNRVVYAEELDEFRPGRSRWYRFRLVSSPIELGREADWQTFKSRFARSYYVSATLRVADSWEFVRRRLDFPEHEVRAVDLPSPFDHATQAELVCFEDFPSWSEHAAAAMHTVAHQVAGYADELVDEQGRNGTMVLTTSRAAAAGIFDWLARLRVERGQSYPLVSAGIEGNQRAVETFKRVGGALVGTRGLWQGVDVAEPERLRLVWINKLPFAPFGDPVISARISLEVEQAALRGEDDPEGYANEHYYLPLAALSLRQAVGRLIRTNRHRGVIVISDRKLAGPTRLRRLYRQVFLGSLDPGLQRADAETGEAWLGNVCTMRAGWQRIFGFYAREGLLTPARAAELSVEPAITEFTELPETLAILEQELSAAEEATHRAAGTLAGELVARSALIAGHLNSSRGPIELKPKQVEALEAVAEGKDLLAVLPTGYGKSYVFQLPALALPGVTIVVSPLVSLMTDQALELNRTIGGRVRALVAPMRESNSRTGKSEIEEELKGVRSHGIKLVYLSPERLSQRHFQEWLRAGVERGIIRRIALDEAHTFVQWGDDFRPAVRRAEDFLRRLKADHAALQLLALTATANETVREGLRSAIFGLGRGADRDDFAFVRANPLRPELAIYRRVLPQRLGGPASIAGLLERVVDTLQGHAIFYCLTVRQVEQVYAHLSDYLQGHPVDVLMYHGRLTDAEKTGTANHFKQTPLRGEDGYRRMVVVATSAFGLGIDRPDIRAVFCVSPPTDLAALYQQLGRAGRDRAASPAAPGPYTAGLAISYPRAQRTISFMTQQRVGDDLLARIAGKLLTAGQVFSARALALDLIDEDLQAARINAEEAAKEETADTYQTGVLRVLAELSLTGIVSDLGDFPRTIDIRLGDYEPDTDGLRELVEAIAAQLPAEHRVETAALHAALEPAFPGEFPDPGALWHTLLELHTLGYLDVSQRPNREQLTAVEHHSRELPESLVRGLADRKRRIAIEVALLRGWFGDTVCCNEGFRRYFAAEELPPGTCAHDDNRCSADWNRAGLPAGAAEPALYEAFTSANLRPASATARGRRRSEEQLDRLVWQLLWHNYAGLVENIIWAVLRGEDHYFSRAERRRKRLWPRLLLSRVRGRKPALRRDELSASLARLVASGEVVQTGAVRFRLRRYVLQDEARAAAAAAEAAAAGEELGESEEAA
jgi:ATP-dependent DNA helicase RecQ